MRRSIALAVALLLAVGGMTFSQEADAPTTEDDAMHMILSEAALLRWTVRDAEIAADALRAMVEAGIEVKSAYRLVSEALRDGLGLREMTMLAKQVRETSRLGLSSAACEIEARTMVQEQIRTRAMTVAQSGEQLQTQLQTQTELQTQAQLQTQTKIQTQTRDGEGTPQEAGTKTETQAGQGQSPGKGK